MSKTLVLLVLAVVWGVALIPPLLRSRIHHRPVSSVTSFRRQLSNLSRVPSSAHLSPSRAFHTPAAPRASLQARQIGNVGYMPRIPYTRYTRSSGSLARSVARRRRQNVLLTLTVVVVGSALIWLGAGVPVARAVFFVSLIALGLYVYLLVMLRRAEEVRVGTAARAYVYSDAA